MQKGLIRKGLAFSVIVLFIGVGIQPVFANDVSISKTLDKDENCIECQISDRISLLRVKILLFKVKVVTNIILSSELGEMPEIKENCEEILDVLNSDILPYNPLMCGIFGSLLFLLLPIAMIVDGYIEIYEEKGMEILYQFYVYIRDNIVNPIGFYVRDLVTYYECF